MVLVSRTTQEEARHRGRKKPGRAGGAREGGRKRGGGGGGGGARRAKGISYGLGVAIMSHSTLPSMPIKPTTPSQIIDTLDSTSWTR